MSDLVSVKNNLVFGISLLRDVIDEHIPQKGDRSDECQKLLLIERLNAFEQAVNGLAQTDLTK